VRRDPLTGEHRVPGETTLRRVLTTIDGDALDAAVTAWLADRLPAPGPRQPRAIAVDGKTLRLRHEVARDEWLRWRRFDVMSKT
jgi:hypothetical protein